MCKHMIDFPFVYPTTLSSSSLSLKSGSMCIANLYPIVLQVKINHTLLSTIRAVIGTLTCTSMASNSTSDSEVVHKSTVIALIV